MDARLRELERARNAQPTRANIEALDAARRRAGDGPWLPARIYLDPVAELRVVLARIGAALGIPMSMLLEAERAWSSTPWSLSRELRRGAPVAPARGTYAFDADNVGQGQLVGLTADGRVGPLGPDAPQLLGVAVSASDARGVVTVRLGGEPAFEPIVPNLPRRRARRRR